VVEPREAWFGCPTNIWLSQDADDEHHDVVHGGGTGVNFGKCDVAVGVGQPQREAREEQAERPWASEFEKLSEVGQS
jgi:hypothetical protein